MQLNHSAAILVLLSMLAFVAHAENSTRPVELSGVATTSNAVIDETAPGPVFLDWSMSGADSIFEFYMPWGINGIRAELLQNDEVIATTSLLARTPFVQRAEFNLKTPGDGVYAYRVNLCSGEATSTGCTTSHMVSVSVRKGEAILESTLPEDEQSIERLRELKDVELNRTAARMEAEMVRMRGLVPSGNQQQLSLEMHAERNIERIRRLITSDVRRVLFAPANTISRSAFFEAAQKFPAFCNESNGRESLDTACARELSAIIAFITYYTGSDTSSSRSGMQYPRGAVSFLGNDASRFMQIIPGKEETLEGRIKEHPDDALLALFWWYMTPQSPEPDPHSALLGIWQPNAIDKTRNIAPGFGAAINIATHGRSCHGGDVLPQGYVLRTLYKGFLSVFNVRDEYTDLCEEQSAFGIGGSAFLPQYWEPGRDGGYCTLDFRENKYFLQNPMSFSLCSSTSRGVATTTHPMLQESFAAAAHLLNVMMDRIGPGEGLHAKSSMPDMRTQLSATIVGTYPYWRAYDGDTQPEQLPLTKLNTLFFEIASPGQEGELLLHDERLMNNEVFAGDCYREDCARGLLHQFALIHERYPKLNIIMSIGGWDGSAHFAKLSDTKKRNRFVTEVRTLLAQHPEIRGVDINWMYPSNLPGNDLINPGGDRETMRQIMIALRDMENRLYEDDGVVRKLYLGVGAGADNINAAGLGEVASLVDGVHLATYDLHGPWEKETGHGAQLFATNIGTDVLSVASVVTLARKAGVPAKKILIGIPYYGRMWSGVEPGSNPLLPGFGTPTNATSSATLIDYRTIATHVLGKGQYQFYEDALRGAVYLYDGDRFISYDAPEMIEKKMQYAWQDGFGGVLLADIMGDDGTLQDKVLSVVAAQSEKKTCRLSRKPDRNLAANSRGADVFALQTFLACLGNIPEHIDINGNYGAATEAGVKLFQKAEGLEVTGVVGKETRERLSKF